MNGVFRGVAHPWLCDVMGHMTTRHYVAMFDDASYHFLYEVFGWTGREAAAGGLGWADVHHEIDYKAEVAAGDLLAVDAAVERVGTKSLTVRFEMRNLSKATVAAVLTSTAVCFDMSERKAAAIPDDWRKAAEAALKRA
ncbi:acyl-CoA thioesterase [Marinicauda salina]|uniref:Acyl-CoA thioesterase n=1 Tax=Marinicauda salina TaxID=2135793 RepID=A0A2U2BUU2_9PROT|nr:thioesterase family protein [Marinicauda salina]PWE17795.1 acyl-CoA thioesterase [Marinicauda salina]